MEGDYDIDDVFAPADDMSEAAAAAPSHLHSLRQELLEERVRAFRQSLGEETPTLLDPNDYVFENNHLYAITDTGEKVLLTSKRNPNQFLAKNTLKQRMNVATQRKLGISDALQTKKLTTQAVAQLQNIEQTLPTNINAIPLQDLSQAADTVVKEIETSFNEEEETALKTIDDEPLPMRDIVALNQTLQNIRGELTNNLAKLSELDEHIEREKNKLAEADDGNLGQEIKERITQRLKDLQDERQARLEVLNQNREQLRSQVSRIRETIHRVLYDDTTLAERIRTLFREQGITIASIITALGFAISTLVVALTGGTAATPPTPPTPPTPKVTDWIKKQLNHLSDLLKKLGAKALDALPGIIGSAVSWLFNTASKVVGYMAEHLWTLALLVAGALLSKIKKS